MVGHRASAFTRPLVALLSLLAACPDHPRPMWWKFRATLSNNGRAFSDGATGALRWSVQVPPQGLIGCPILWSPAAYNSWTDARVLVGDGAGVLSGILPLQGNIEWQFHTGDAITGCADAPLNQSAVYVANASGAVFALPASKPQQAIWKHPLVPGSSVLPTSPAVSGDYVYIGGGSVLYALRTTNGSEAWHYPMPAQIVVVSAPLVTEDVNGEGIVVAAENGTVAKVTSDAGQPVWSKTVTTQPIVESPALGTDGSIYVTASDGVVRALRGDDGGVRWSFDTKTKAHLSAPAVWLSGKIDHVYVCDNQSTVYALDATNNGNVLWSFPLPGVGCTAPVVTPTGVVYVGVGDSVFALNGNGRLWAYGKTTGSVLGLAVAEDGTIYATAGQRLYAIH